MSNIKKYYLSVRTGDGHMSDRSFDSKDVVVEDQDLWVKYEDYKKLEDLFEAAMVRHNALEQKDQLFNCACVMCQWPHTFTFKGDPNTAIFKSDTN